MNPEDELDPTEDQTGDDNSVAVDLTIVYEAQTERLKVYAALLRATIPRIGATSRADFAKEAEIDPDVNSARNLAIESIFTDIRRIARSGNPDTFPPSN